MTNRRSFLGAILALGAAPAIVRADSLMKIVVPKLWLPRGCNPGSWDSVRWSGSYEDDLMRGSQWTEGQMEWFRAGDFITIEGNFEPNGQLRRFKVVSPRDEYLGKPLLSFA